MRMNRNSMLPRAAIKWLQNQLLALCCQWKVCYRGRALSAEVRLRLMAWAAHRVHSASWLLQSLTPNMQIIGIDCSTNPKGMGFALGRIVDGCCQVESAVAGTRHAENVERVCQWLASGTPTLLCVDAPLGGLRRSRHPSAHIRRAALSPKYLISFFVGRQTATSSAN